MCLIVLYRGHLASLHLLAPHRHLTFLVSKPLGRQHRWSLAGNNLEQMITSLSRTRGVAVLKIEAVGVAGAGESERG